MENNIQGYKSASTGWSFYHDAYLRNGFRGFFPRSDQPLINMIHVFLWKNITSILVLGRSSFVKAEIPNSRRLYLSQNR